VTFLTPRLDPVPGLLWVINTLDEWPHVYCQYRPVPTVQDRMVSETSSQLREVPTAIGECLLQPPTAKPGIRPVLGLILHSGLRPDQPGIRPVLSLVLHSGLKPWLIVGLDLPCTRPTAFAYTVLACSRLRGKAIGIKGRCQCHHSRFGQPYRVTSLASPCRPRPNDFLMVFMFRSVRRPLPCSVGWLSLSLDLLVISPISLMQSCCLRVLRVWLVHPVSSRGFSTTGTGSTPRPVGISPYLVPPVGPTRGLPCKRIAPKGSDTIPTVSVCLHTVEIKVWCSPLLPGGILITCTWST